MTAKNSELTVNEETTTDKDGAYRLALPAGSYEIAAEAEGLMGGCETELRDVAPGRFTDVDIGCDTGIR